MKKGRPLRTWKKKVEEESMKFGLRRITLNAISIYSFLSKFPVTTALICYADPSTLDRLTFLRFGLVELVDKFCYISFGVSPTCFKLLCDGVR